jgi:mannose-1-phosphate guanylyltransferase
MQEAGRRPWALVLAGGDGSRLRALTTAPCGSAVPKQFCSLHGGQSLLEDAFDRAAAITDAPHIATILAYQHRQWWAEIERVAQLSPGNVIVQPRNRGTAIGVLYSLLHLQVRDPHAQVVLLPADHYVSDEPALHGALLRALEHTRRDQMHPVLLGVEPDEIDCELGYILPGRPDGRGGRKVARFIEKPDATRAGQIITAGGLWNSFIITASAHALIDLFLPRFAPLVTEMQLILSRGFAAGSPTGAWPAIVDLYERLPDLDFSRDLLQGQEHKLSVVPAPACGWSDLGTPRRVGETLKRMHASGHRRFEPLRTPYINLAAQHALKAGMSDRGLGTG